MHKNKHLSVEFGHNIEEVGSCHKGVLMEAISAMTHLKKLVNQITLKDQLLKDKCLEHLDDSLFSRLESDIAKSAIRDYEI